MNPSERTIVVIGWDGASNPIYRFHAELGLPSYERRIPTVAEVVAEYPDAEAYGPGFKRYRLADKLENSK